MRSQIPLPVKGQGLRANWGCQVAGRVNELCAMAPSGMLARDGFGGMGAQPLPVNARTRAKLQLHPYAVAWSGTVNEGAGGWIIWLPGDSLLVYDGIAVDVRTNLTEAGEGFADGWYLLDMVPADEDSVVYMAINTTAATTYVEFDVEADGMGDDGFDVVICETYVDPETGAKHVKQFVSSVLTFGGEPAETRDNYGCDERSISLIASMDGEALEHGHHFYLAGFGRFTVPGRASPYGTFAASSVLEIGESASSVAVLVRSGDTNTPNGNILEYRRLKVVGGGAAKPACFDLATETTESNGVSVATHKLVRCWYNVGDQLHHVSDIDISAMLLTVASGNILAFVREGYSGAWGARLFAAFGDLQTFQQKASNVAVPLYVMAGSGATVSVDLRNAPKIQMVEDLTP